MEMTETRRENKRFRERKENKGVVEYFGANLPYLFNLFQVKYSKELPPAHHL